MSTLTAEIPERNGNLTVVNPPTLPEERKGLTKKEIAADHPTWCPGCGDFSVLALYFKLIEKRKMWHEKITTVAGIGCSSRFPYFRAGTRRTLHPRTRAAIRQRHLTFAS
jgi:pyruvate/2-oxoacid:ferredoxin oxidoreductase beta subunit